MIYEWRTYEAMPGKLPALHTHLEVAAGLFKKSILGFLEKRIFIERHVHYREFLDLVI